MAVAVKLRGANRKGNGNLKSEKKLQETKPAEATNPTAHGVIYSKRLNVCPFSAPPPEAYAPIIGDERMERLQRAAERLKDLKILELNATAQGGGVADRFVERRAAGDVRQQNRGVSPFRRHDLCPSTQPT